MEGQTTKIIVTEIGTLFTNNNGKIMKLRPFLNEIKLYSCNDFNTTY